jgi:hypothetical protein
VAALRGQGLHTGSYTQRCSYLMSPESPTSRCCHPDPVPALPCMSPLLISDSRMLPPSRTMTPSYSTYTHTSYSHAIRPCAIGWAGGRVVAIGKGHGWQHSEVRGYTQAATHDSAATWCRLNICNTSKCCHPDRVPALPCMSPLLISDSRILCCPGPEDCDTFIFYIYTHHTATLRACTIGWAAAGVHVVAVEEGGSGVAAFITQWLHTGSHIYFGCLVSLWMSR